MTNTAQTRLKLKLLLAMALTFGLTSNQWPFSSKTSAALTINLKTESQLKSEAALYDTAIREISRIENLQLTVAQDSKLAEGILEQNVSNLRFARSKLIAVALSASSFVSAVKAKVFDQKSAEQFAQELGQDANAIFKLSGAAAVRDEIRSKAAADAARLQKIVGLLREAEAKERTEAHLDPVVVSSIVAVALVAAIAVSIVITAAVIASLVNLGPALVAVAATVGTVGASAAAARIAAGAAAVVAGVEAVASSGKEKIAVCQDKADSSYNRCKSRANAEPEPFRTIDREGCYKDWLAAGAYCLLTE